MRRWTSAVAALAVVAVVVVVFMPGDAGDTAAPPAEPPAPPTETAQPTNEPADEPEASEPVEAETTETVAEQQAPADDETPPPRPDVINEQTLVDTTWGRGGFEIEFGPDGALRIGGRDRARWQIIGDRIHLYSETTDEEHWLEIDGNRITWQGQDIARTK